MIVLCLFTCTAFILILYLEVFQVYRSLKNAVAAGFVINFLATFPQIPIAAALCGPPPGQAWTAALGQNCARSEYWGITQSLLGTILDVLLFCIPIPIIWRLQMSRSRKFAVSAVFATTLW